MGTTHCITPEIHLRRVFESFAHAICRQCNRVLESSDDTPDAVHVYRFLIPGVVEDLVESVYFREFAPYVTVSPSEGGVVVDVTASNNRICGWTCVESTSERAALQLTCGRVIFVRD